MLPPRRFSDVASDLARAMRVAAQMLGMVVMMTVAIPAGPATAATTASAVEPGRRSPQSPRACALSPDALARVQCRGELRVGIRADYPPFGQTTPAGPQGFEPALARRLTARLGVVPRFVEVSAADRMVALGEGRVDVLVATTGHTVQRDAQALFVRPHYYQSNTVVVGPRSLRLEKGDGLPALFGRTVCVTIGNSTNAELAVRGGRLMLFASARQLVEQVRNGACALAAHDDSLLLPLLPAGHEVKASFAPLPWGVVVPLDGASMARVFSQALRRDHADGTLVRLAETHGVDARWLREQQRRWSSWPCDQPGELAARETTDGPDAGDTQGCFDPPRDSQLAATPIAETVDRMERWLRERWGLELTLAMLKTQVALRLFLEGVSMSVALVLGAVLATGVLALAFGAALTARGRWLRWPARGALAAVQSTPLVLHMSVAGLLLSSAGLATMGMVWLVAVAVLGLFNGSHAGQALAESRICLSAAGEPSGLLAAGLHARAQLIAFAANATRGTPAASLIGVPELLAAQTDIASFSSESSTTFVVLLVVYVALVAGVMALLHRLERRLRTLDARP
ncbi:transporter substrate-binding domain-containing protein [Roseateles aquatilis]|nr:transporter substrate-binding domain-containing protein [Roseateles aquatilis]